MSALLANDYVAKVSVSKSSKSGSSHSTSKSTTHHTGTSTSHYRPSSYHHHHSGAGSFLGGILVLALIAAAVVAGVFFPTSAQSAVSLPPDRALPRTGARSVSLPATARTFDDAR